MFKHVIDKNMLDGCIHMPIEHNNICNWNPPH